MELGMAPMIEVGMAMQGRQLWVVEVGTGLGKVKGWAQLLWASAM